MQHSQATPWHHCGAKMRIVSVDRRAELLRARMVEWRLMSLRYSYLRFHG